MIGAYGDDEGGSDAGQSYLVTDLFASNLLLNDSEVIPFFVNVSNPNVVSLSKDESSIVSWLVNVSSGVGYSYDFYSTAIITSNSDWVNESVHYNLSVIDDTLPEVVLDSPSDLTSDSVQTYDFICNVSEDYSLGNASLYVWNSSGNLIYNPVVDLIISNPYLFNTSASLSWEYSLSYSGVFEWNCKVFDEFGNVGWADNNFSVEVTTIPVVGVDWITPTAHTNVSKNLFTEFSVNVSCANADCGLVNVSLDPLIGGGTITEVNDWGMSYLRHDQDFWDSGWVGFTSGVEAGNCYEPDDAMGGEFYFYDGGALASTVQVGDTFVYYDTQSECEAAVIQAKSGLVSTNSSNELFYTNKSSNPFTINLSAGESEIVTFWVNATGDLDSVHEFFAFVNRTIDMSQSDETSHFNVTISNFLPVAQSVVISSDDVLNGSNSNLTGSFSYYDQDGHSQSANETRWFNNSVEVVSLRNKTYVGSGNLTRFDNWTFSTRFYDSLEWGSWVNSSNFTVENYVPIISSVTITPSSPTSSDDLNCSVSGWSDGDGDSADYWYVWRNNTVVVYTVHTTNTSHVVSSVDTLEGEVWNCTVIPYDGYENGTAKTDQVTINNDPPEKPILLLPVNWNNTLFNLSPTFVWNCTDNDADSLNFTLEINITAAPNYNYPNLEGSSLDPSGNNYTKTIGDELQTYVETGNNNYTWRVRAYDGTNYSEWSDIYSFSIEETVIINMINNFTDFSQSSLLPLESANTDNDSVNPFSFQNVGNVNATLKTMSTTSFWVSEDLGTEYLQYKADTNVGGSTFNESGSTMDWTYFENESVSNEYVIRNLDFHSSENYAEVDIKITVPGQEPPGTRSSELIFYWLVSETYT